MYASEQCRSFAFSSTYEQNAGAFGITSSYRTVADVSPEEHRVFSHASDNNLDGTRAISPRRYWLVATARIVVKAFPLNRSPNAPNERPLAVNWIDPEIPAVDFHTLGKSKAV